jgi:hypothetical protein
MGNFLFKGSFLFRICEIPMKLRIKNKFFPREISFKIRVHNSGEKNSKYPSNGIIYEGTVEKDILNLNQNVKLVYRIH